ncbi:MAG: pteridine reductase [Candidatus Pelagadaptatus aseana]|uniref:pteridine reductase n=1 Tax=Candidatus Pelagadaptatus aseana TaxID=3120508 RepID=UPI0039B1DAC8
MNQQINEPIKVALITGAARRIGAEIARQLHQRGLNIVIHCRQSTGDADTLRHSLNQQRPDSCQVVQADLSDNQQVIELAQQAKDCFGRLDVLINNASSFYPTPIGEGSEAQWDDLFASNAKAPFFLSQALAPELTKRGGSIVNICDIHADKPLGQHTIYCMAKAANVMLTQSLAKELAPDVRVNGVSPGAILWPEQEAELEPQGQQKILRQIPLARTGKPHNIATTVTFLALDNDYITGQIIPVDGGRSLGH